MTGGADGLAPGARAPGFRLPSDAGCEVSLKDFAGRPVVLYFYPKDDTSGCTTEACGFRDSWAEVQAAGAVVLGVSPDGVASHRKFKARYELPFPLLVDADHAVAEAYGAWGEKSMYGRKYFGILRKTFIIDGRGRISHVFGKVKPRGHAAEVLAALAGDP
ncbi:MAG TPA: thioredoxin-dependent thiol peroxidase [Gemmatimonadales bacterium]|nr:thioredoxin-dependent thiol peroxidase [Gemmatimonadales bacterium]